jgi:hypothetical protein
MEKLSSVGKFHDVRLNKFVMKFVADNIPNFDVRGWVWRLLVARMATMLSLSCPRGRRRLPGQPLTGSGRSAGY